MRLLLAFMLTLLTSNAMAEWTAIAKVNAFGGGAVLYVDRVRTQSDDKTIKMWSLMDFKNEQGIEGIKFMSSKLQKEYDCNKKQWRILSSSMFSKNMGKGDSVQSDDAPDEWRPVEADSLGKTEWDIVCKERRR